MRCQLPAGLGRAVSDDGAAGAVETPRQLIEGHAKGVIGAVGQRAVLLVLDVLDRHIPDPGSALDHLAAHVLAGLVNGSTHLEGDTAAAGAAAVADAVGVHDGRLGCVPRAVRELRQRAWP